LEFIGRISDFRKVNFTVGIVTVILNVIIIIVIVALVSVVIGIFTVVIVIARCLRTRRFSTSPMITDASLVVINRVD